METPIRNKIKEFSLVALKIDEQFDNKIIRCLHPGFYLFNKRYKFSNEISGNQSYYNLYPHNITVQAIVGKNGSGKSSVLEMVYRIINNFSALSERNLQNKRNELPLYVNGVYADLYYSIGDKLHCISCKGEQISVIFDVCNKKKIVNFSQNKSTENPIKNQKELADLSKEIFYTIVSNYSFQSLIPSDYSEESVQENVGGENWNDSEYWLSHLFNKNDGYVTPIVLNPYRDDSGNISTEKETQFARTRLSSLLIKFRDKEIIEGYTLHEIVYAFDKKYIESKFLKHIYNGVSIIDRYNQNKDPFKNNSFIKYKSNFNQNSYTYRILDELKCVPNNLPKEMEEITNHLCAYVVYKVLKIAQTYQCFGEYSEFGGIAKFNRNIKNIQEEEKFTEYLKKLKKDKSHITFKLHQTLNLLECIKNSSNNAGFLYSSFTDEKYFNFTKVTTRDLSSEGIVRKMPPPMFTPEIYLNKIEPKKKSNKGSTVVSFSSLSSGERQLAFILSLYCYHIMNLRSVQDSKRVRYRYFNLIFDEVEMCYHPEYQRVFVDKLIKLLKDLHLTTHCSFNIILATHSPFILSDIPQCNILYLKEGKNVSGKIDVNPFAANVNDILHQSFFLENGFMGEYAKQCINKLTDELSKVKNGKGSSSNKNDIIIKANNLVDNVGDIVLKNLLNELYNDTFKDIKS